MERDFDLYESKDGKSYAVLVSHGYGAEWSDGDPQLACDKRIVEFWLKHKNDKKFMREIDDFSRPRNESLIECDEFFRSLGFDDTPYMGGFPNICMHWMDHGIAWRIRSYDGSEYIEEYNPENYIMF